MKRGDPGALEVLGFRNHDSLRIIGVRVDPAVARIGESVRVEFSVVNTAEFAGIYNLDLKVHFVKANGSTSAKVFKVRQIELAPRESQTLSKKISLAQHSTRTHYPGRHVVEVVTNGSVEHLGLFDVVPA